MVSCITRALVRLAWPLMLSAATIWPVRFTIGAASDTWLRDVAKVLNRRLDLPLHPSWAEWLWSHGLENGEVETLTSVGAHAFRCRPEPEALREDIGEAVRRRVLSVQSDDADDNVELKAA